MSLIPKWVLRLMKLSNTRIVVGLSGGVTSAWCAGWALRTYPKENVILLFHDTKEEDADTYRFIKELQQVLNHPVIERSDGRSVTEVMRDEGVLANNRMAFCSRILKVIPRAKFFEELKEAGINDITLVLGFSGKEWQRIQRATMNAEHGGYKVRFPVVENNVSKQQCVDWVEQELGLCAPSMYTWSDHANCVGCVRGGKAYWLAVKEYAPDVFQQRCALETEFGHTILPDTSLIQLATTGLKRTVNRKEAIEIGPCECGS